MPVTVTKLVDTDTTAIVRVTGYFTAANTSNVALLTANTLRFANASQPCRVDVEKVEWAAKMNGYIAPTFITTSGPNTQIATLASGGGSMMGYFSSEATANTNGDLGLEIYNGVANDSFTLTLTLRKVTGFANAFAQYDGVGVGA